MKNLIKSYKIFLSSSKINALLYLWLTIMLSIIPVLFTWSTNNLFIALDENNSYKKALLIIYLVISMKIIFEILINYPRSYGLYTKTPYYIRKKILINKMKNLYFLSANEKQLEVDAFNFLTTNLYQKYLITQLNYYINLVTIFLLFIINVKINPFLISIIIISYSYNFVVVSKKIDKTHELNKEVNNSFEEYRDFKIYLYQNETFKNLIVNNEVARIKKKYQKLRNKTYENKYRYNNQKRKNELNTSLATNIGYILIIVMNLFLIHFVKQYTITTFATSIITTGIFVKKLEQHTQDKNFLKEMNIRFEGFYKYLNLDSNLEEVSNFNEIYLTNKRNDLMIKKGDKVLITGKNGVGKSTLIDVMLGVNKENYFELFIDNVKKENYILNNATLFQQDLLEYFDDQMVNMSSGEKKLKKLKEFLSQDKEVFIFDEPFTNVDKENILLYLDLIKEKLVNKTVVFILYEKTENLDEFINKRYVLINDFEVLNAE